MDDELGSIKSLEWELSLFSDEVEIVASHTDVYKAIGDVRNKQPDILFLDINMPEMDGFEVIEKLGNVKCHVVFTTAYDEHALKAFSTYAIDYLLKPVGQSDLRRSINKIKGASHGQQDIETIRKLISEMAHHEGSEVVTVGDAEGVHFIRQRDLVRCEADGNYTRLHFVDRDSLLIAKSLKHLEEKVDSKRFARIHHSHLVNLEFVKMYKRGKGGSVILQDGTVVPVARSRKHAFLDHDKDY